MKVSRKIAALAVCLILLLCLAAPALAHEVPDWDRKGSVTVTLKVNGTPVTDLGLTLYRVGEIYSDNGDMLFRPAGYFDRCGLDFSDVSKPELASALAKYARDNAITGTASTSGADGKHLFSDLPLGLYLVVQHKSGKDYTMTAPFLISVPQNDGTGHYVYDVNASPKTGVEAVPTTVPTTPSWIPKTGQVDWPIPAMALGGITLICLGLYLRRRPGSQEQD